MKLRPFTLIFLPILAIDMRAVLALQNEEGAKSAAQAWLSLVDSGRYGESWDAAGPYMQKAVPRKQWERKLATDRKPLGEAVSRELKSAAPGKDRMGVPGGDYFKLQFNTEFSNKKQAIETVTSVLQKDGKWKVSGYYIE